MIERQWADFSGTEEFKALPDDVREKERINFFEAKVAPTIPAENRHRARAIWDRHTLPKPKAPTPVPEEDRDNAFEYSVDRAQQLVGRGVQAAGEFVGSDTVADFGKRVVEQQDLDIEKGGYTPDHKGSFSETLENDGIMAGLGWTGEKLAENWATTGASVLGGLAALATAPFSVPAALAIGVGVTGYSLLSGTGEIAQEMDEQGIEANNGLALLGGAGIAALDRIGVGKVLPKAKLVDLGRRLNSMTGEELVKELASEGAQEAAEKVQKLIFKGAAEVKDGIAKKAIKGFGAEGATEAAQESLIMGAVALEGGEYTPREVVDRMIDATILGGTMGAGASPFGSGVSPGGERAKLLQDPEASPDQRLQAAKVIAGQYKKQSPAMAAAFLDHAVKRISTRQPVLSEGESLYDQLKPLQQHRIDQEMMAQAESVLAEQGGDIHIGERMDADGFASDDHLPDPRDPDGLGGIDPAAPAGVDPLSTAAEAGQPLGRATLAENLRETTALAKAAMESEEGVSPEMREDLQSLVKIDRMLAAGKQQEAEAAWKDHLAVRQERLASAEEPAATPPESGPSPTQAPHQRIEQPQRDQLQGLDEWIRRAETLGFEEEVVRLRNAQTLYTEANEALESGDTAKAERFRTRANTIYRDILGDESAVVARSKEAGLPVPVVMEGEIMPEEAQPEPVAALPQSAIEGEATEVPEPARLPAPAKLLEDAGIIYGGAPEAVVHGNEPGTVLVVRKNGRPFKGPEGAMASQAGAAPGARAIEVEGGYAVVVPYTRQTSQTPDTRPEPAPVARQGEWTPDEGALPTAREQVAQAEREELQGQVDEARKNLTGKVKKADKKSELQSMIRQYGGINAAEAESQGFDPEDIKDMVARGVLRRKGGKSFDEMAEALDQDGFFGGEAYGPSVLMDMLHQSRNGEPVHSPQSSAHEEALAANGEVEQAERELAAFEQRQAQDDPELRPEVPTVEEIDVFVGPNPESTRVFIMDQKQEGGSRGGFDEHKLGMAFSTQEEFEKAYLDSYDTGWEVGPIAEVTPEQLADWIENGDTTKPFAEANSEAFTVDGEGFVHGQDGSKDLGEITAEISTAIRRQAGPVRLEVGDKKFGVVHIRQRHGGEIQTAGFESVEAFVEHVAKNFTQVKKGDGGRLMLVIPPAEGKKTGAGAYISLKPDPDGDFYTVETASPWSGRSLAKRELLWEGAAPPSTESGDQSRFASSADEGASQQSANGSTLGQSQDSIAQPEKASATEKPSRKKPTKKQTVAAKKPVSDKAESKGDQEKIDDFGVKKVGGARKDIAKYERAAAIAQMKDEEIASQPLSKLWPKKSLDEIEDPFLAAFAYAARAEVPTKPQKSYKLKRWVESVKAMSGLMKTIGDAIESGDSEITDRVMKRLKGTVALQHFGAKVELLQAIDRQYWDQIDSVQEHPDAFRYSDEKDENGRSIKIPTPQVWLKLKPRATKTFSGSGKWQDHLDDIKAVLEGKAGEEKRIAFEIRGRGDSNHLYKKGDREYRKVAGPFKTPAEARAYLNEHYDEVLASWEDIKARDNVRKTDTRNKNNRPRTGKDYRNGEDVTPEQFQDAFGFNWTEFGEYVKQGKGAKERQGMLNQAYDALMDMANIIGVPPKAMSLEGQLSLAFGARGRGGWAAAHFEPGTLAINLTKTQGAGSLAHEWFHALDNYFLRKRDAGVDSPSELFITYRPEPMMVHKTSGTKMTKSQLEARRENSPNADFFAAKNWHKDPAHPKGVRPEVEERFAALVKALDESPMAARSRRNDKKADGYWGQIIERAARSFENYIITKMHNEGYDNDFLANVVPPKDWKKNEDRYPYLKPDEMAPIEEAFDNLFSTIEAKETDSGIALFSRDRRDDVRAISAHDAGKVIERIVSGWRGGLGRKDEIALVESFDQLPDTVKQRAKEQGAENDVIAVFHDGKTYVDLSKIRDEKDLEQAIFHETYGHYGLRKVFGKQLPKKLNELYVALGGDKGIREAAERNGVNIDDYFAGFDQAVTAGAMTTAQRQGFLADELLAHIQQDNRPTVRRLVKEITGMIRQGLRRMGFLKTSEVSDSEIFALLRKTRQAVQKNEDGDGRGTMFMVAYHGSPHRFDEFSTDQIGTGEGIQAYGWGLYFAQQGEVAEVYSEALSPDGKGHVYQVDVPEMSELLDWDKPMGEQPRAVRSALSQADFNGDEVIAAWKENGAWEHISGEVLYRHLADGLTEGAAIRGADKAASMYLDSIGIPGLHYLDGYSRPGGGQSTHNFVIWDDSRIQTDAIDGVPTAGLPDVGEVSDEEAAKYFGRDTGDTIGLMQDSFDTNTTLYHGTDRDFEQFKPHEGLMGKAVYLSDSASASSKYAQGEVVGKGSGGSPRVIPVHIRGQIFRESDITQDLEVAAYRAAGLELMADETAAIPADEYAPDFDYFLEVLNRDGKLADALTDLGYTGINAREAFNVGGIRTGEEYESYAIFDPANIKSAYAVDGGPVFLRQRQQALSERLTWKAVKDGVNDRLDGFRFQVQDKLIDLKRLQQRIENSGVTLNDASNAYQKAAIWEGRAGEKLNDFDEGSVQPLLEEISRSGLDVIEVGEWLVARHAEEANAYLAEINPDKDEAERNRLSGMSNDEAAEILGRHTGNRHLQTVGEMIDQINRDRVSMLVSEGLISQEEADAWQGRYEHYVPLKREEADEARADMMLPGRGQGFSLKGRESKKRTGSAYWSPAQIIANTLSQYEMSVVRAEKNRVGKALLNMVEEHPQEDFWQVATDRVTKQVVDGKVREMPRSMLLPNELSVKRDGVEHVIQFQPGNQQAERLVNGLKNLSAQDMGAVIRGMATVTRFLSNVNTSWNPEFIISNFARDIQTAGYNLADTELSDMEMRVMKETFPAMRGIYRALLRGDTSSEWAQLWEDFRKHGGKTGWIDIHQDVKIRERDLQKMVERLNDGKNPEQAYKRFGKFVDNANAVVENAVRLSAYKNALEQGLSKEKAAALAKDLTVNFNRKGNLSPTINAMYMFANASVQGSMRLLQAMVRSKKGRALAASTVGFAVMLDMINRSLSGEDDDGENIYDQLPDYVKNHNLIIMGEKEPLVKIPLPWGYNVLHTVGQVIGTGISADRFDPLAAASRVSISTIEAFNPVGSATIAQTIAPTLLDPVVQISENKAFHGGPLKPEHTYDSRRPKPEYQMHWSAMKDDDWEKRIAKFANDISGGNEVRPGALNWSPEWIELVYDTALGGMGRTASNSLSFVDGLLKGEDIAVEKTPFLRKVTGHNSENAVKYRYYEWGLDVAYAKAELKELKGKDLAKAQRQPAAKLIGRHTAAEKTLRSLRKSRRNLVQNNAPEDRIDQVDAQIRAVMADFNRRYVETVLRE